MDNQKSIRGCLLSGALGDAIGSHFENNAAGSTFELDALHSLSISDDTQLTLATCEAIVERKSVDPDAISKHFLRVYNDPGISGIGSSTLKAMKDLEAGAHWYLAGNRGEKSAGNGAAMRIAPIAFCSKIDMDELPFIVREICTITHKNDEAFAGALAVCLSIRILISGASTNEPAYSLNEYLPNTNVRDALNILNKSADMSILEASKITGTSGYVAESVPFAIFSAVKAKHIGLMQMIKESIYCGGDTDTNTSIAAQISGSYLGLPASCESLIPKIREYEYINRIVADFTRFLIH